MIAFWSIAAIIWLLLLAVILKPLLSRRKTKRTQKLSSFKSRAVVGALMAVFVVASSALLYVYWSNGYSVLAASTDTETDMVQLTEQLAQRMEQSPDNPEGWLLLASSYAALGLYDRAVTAYAQAERYTKLEAWSQIGYAEALLVAEGALNDKANSLLEAAIQTKPDNPQALFLIGLANLERENYSQTISHWEHLLGLLEEDSSLTNAVEEKLKEVRQLAADRPEADQSNPSQTPSDEQTRDSAAVQSKSSDEHCFIRVDLMLASELKEKISPTDTLFVYAKASPGPPMPLAIKQFTAAALPLETCLGPDDAMIAGMTINRFGSIRIVARISSSGLATPQSGDLQAQSEPLPVAAGNAVSLVIDEILE